MDDTVKFGSLMLLKHKDSWRGDYYLDNELTFTTNKKDAARIFLVPSLDQRNQRELWEEDVFGIGVIQIHQNKIMDHYLCISDMPMNDASAPTKNSYFKLYNDDHKHLVPHFYVRSAEAIMYDGPSGDDEDSWDRDDVKSVSYYKPIIISRDGNTEAHKILTYRWDMESTANVTQDSMIHFRPKKQPVLMEVEMPSMIENEHVFYLEPYLECPNVNNKNESKVITPYVVDIMDNLASVCQTSDRGTKQQNATIT